MLESNLQTAACDFLITNVKGRNPVTDEYVLECSSLKNNEIVVIVGKCFFEPKTEMTVCVSGSYSEHSQYGHCYMANAIWPSDLEIPLSGKVIGAFVATGAIKGIGSSIAGTLQKNIDDSFLDTLENNPSALSSIPNMGPKKIEILQQFFEGKNIERDTEIFLLGHGINKKLSQQIFETYGCAASLVLMNSPYQLLMDIEGLRLNAIDELAKLFGIERSSPMRIDTLVLHKLKALYQESGSSTTLRKELEKSVARILRVTIKAVNERVDQLLALGKVNTDSTMISLAPALLGLDTTLSASSSVMLVQATTTSSPAKATTLPVSGKTPDNWEDKMNESFANLRAKLQNLIAERSLKDEIEITHLAQEKIEALEQKFTA